MASARAFSAVVSLAMLCACSANDADGNAAVCNAAAGGASHREVVADGTIVRVLGVRQGRTDAHEGFLLNVPCAGAPLTVRVEANTSFTGVMPARRGATAEVKGEYEYNSLGGVIHWTHRDPRGRHPGGYVRIAGATYQ